MSESIPPDNSENKDSDNKDDKLELPKEILTFLNENIQPEKLKEAESKVKEFFKLTRITKQSQHFQASYSYESPIPPPEILKGYNDAVPNGAERILKMAEKQSEHRIGLESTAIPAQFKQSSRGQVFGFIIALFVVSLATIAALWGHDKTFPSIMGGTTVLGLVTVFVTGQYKQKKELAEKSPEQISSSD